MFKKIATVLVLCLTLLGMLGIGVAFKHYEVKNFKKEQELNKKIKEYEERDLRLSNMQKTLAVIYNLSDYEARYYSFIFDDFSQKYGIPWEVYPALVRIESNFNSGVISKDKAKGITQVLETTGKIQADKMGIPFNEGTLWNCVLNMAIGFGYFSDGYAEATSMTPDSALKHAIKRYCGGPGYAKSNPDARIYVKEYKSTVWDEFIRVEYVYKGIMYDQLINAQQAEKRADINRPLLALMFNRLGKKFS